MQFSVPQFVDVEDKILPHLTIKQFLVVVGCGILGLIYWGIFGLSLPFFVLLIPTLLIVLPIAFVKFNGRPIMSNLPGLIHFFATPRERIFVRGARMTLHQKTTPLKEQQTSTDEEPAASRLKKLAYLLDQKAAEEERLLRTGEYSNKWLNEV